MKAFVTSLLVAAVASYQIQTEDYNQDLIDANAVSTAQMNLANAIKTTEYVFNTAEEVMANIEKLMEEDPVFAVLGFVSSMAKYFVENKEYKKILEELSNIEAQIDFLQQDMEYYFNKVLAAVHQETCYAEYAGYELTLIQAVSKYNDWLAHQDDPDIGNVYKQAFMDECANAKCDDATSALASSITGESGLFGCDMMDILYSGDVQSGYFVGWRDNVAAKAGYLLSLVNMGVTVQSAYITLETDNDQAYRVVQEEYGDILLKAAKRITDFDSKAVNDWYQNAEINSSRILQLNADAGLDDEHMSSSTFDQLQTINPYRRW